jgi:hypothetical protein
LAGRSSSEIRGRQVAATNDSFFYNDQERIDTNIVRDCNEIIFVRNFLPGLAQQLRSTGKRVGFDLLDRPVADVHKLYRTGIDDPQVDWSVYSNIPCDFLIVNNDLTKRMILEHRRDLSVHVIPHHSCNFKEVENDKPEKIKTVGYVGLSDQISHQEEIRNYLMNLDVELVVTNPQSRHEVIEAHKKIDVGLIFLNRGDYYENVLKFKPNTKLTNFQSFGIPTIACGYQSFLEFGGDAFLRVETLQNVFDALKNVIENSDLRNSLSAAGLENAKKLSIKNIAELYRF